MDIKKIQLFRDTRVELRNLSKLKTWKIGVHKHLARVSKNSVHTYYHEIMYIRLTYDFYNRISRINLRFSEIKF